MPRSKKRTVGYKYYVGVHMALFHAKADKITRVKVDDKEVWRGTSTGGAITIDAEDIFGGKSREGGVSGTLRFLPGGSTQTQNSYLLGVLGSLVPAFKGVASIVLEHMYLSMNPYLKVWGTLAQRIHYQQDGTTQWQDSLAQIDVSVCDTDGSTVTVAAMNPAHIIRECLTNTKWGMGYNTGDIDETSFLACANTLFTEGMGMCLTWDTQKSIEDFVKIVLQHIEAVIDVDRRTGKFCLTLIRNDYDVNDLITLDASNIDRITDFKRPAFGELCTSITVNYWDVMGDKSASLTVQDIALEQEQGTGGNNTTVTYEGFVDSNTVSRVAQRDLVSLSTPLVSCTVYATKVARDLRVGRCFILTWPDYQIEGLVMRVTEIAYGNGKTRRVRIKCAQDVFSYPEDAFVVDPGTGWADPNVPPGAARQEIAFEAPYYELVRRGGATAVNALLVENPYLGYVAAAATAPVEASINAELWTDSGAGYEDVITLDFCAGGTLTADMGLTDTTFTLANVQNLTTVVAGTLLQMGDELMVYVSEASNVVTVKRGALDTLPQLHTAGEAVLFWDEGIAVDPTEYDLSDEVDCKVTPVNGSGVYAVASATALPVTVAGRANLPFNAAQIKIDGVYYPAIDVRHPGDIEMTWAHRNRKTQTGTTILGFVDAGISIEPGVEYEIRIYDIDNVLQFTYTGLTGTSYTIPSADLATVAPFAFIEMDSYRGDFYSFQTYRHQVQVGSLEFTEGGDYIETESGDPLELEA